MPQPPFIPPAGSPITPRPGAHREILAGLAAAAARKDWVPGGITAEGESDQALPAIPQIALFEITDNFTSGDPSDGTPNPPYGNWFHAPATKVEYYPAPAKWSTPANAGDETTIPLQVDVLAFRRLPARQHRRRPQHARRPRGSLPVHAGRRPRPVGLVPLRRGGRNLGHAPALRGHYPRAACRRLVRLRLGHGEYPDRQWRRRRVARLCHGLRGNCLRSVGDHRQRSLVAPRFIRQLLHARPHMRDPETIRRRQRLGAVALHAGPMRQWQRVRGLRQRHTALHATGRRHLQLRRARRRPRLLDRSLVYGQRRRIRRQRQRLGKQRRFIGWQLPVRPGADREPVPTNTRTTVRPAIPKPTPVTSPVRPARRRQGSTSPISTRTTPTTRRPCKPPHNTPASPLPSIAPKPKSGVAPPSAAVPLKAAPFAPTIASSFATARLPIFRPTPT